MNPLYNIGISLYGAAARLASLQSKKVSDMIAGQALPSIPSNPSA